jgi:hypothetical protein
MLLSAGCAALLGGCGDGDARVATETAPTAPPTATATAAITPIMTPPPTPTATPTAAATVDPGGGDEGGNRTLVKLTLGVEDVDPAEIEVPAFLGLEFEITNRSGSERIIKSGDKVILELLPGDTERGVLEGLRPGEHFLDVGESGRVKIVAKRAS